MIEHHWHVAWAVGAAGKFQLEKFRHHAALHGVRHAAWLQRKQGVPLATTLLLLRALR